MFSIQPEQLYRHIVETSTEGIWIVDDEMRTQFVNRRMAEMLGYTADEMAETSLLNYVFDEDKEKVYKEREHRRSGLSEQYETRLKHKNGSTLWARISTNPLYDESGKFIGALGMFTDITENKESEDRLEKAEERYRAFIGQSSEGIWRFEFENPVPVNLPADEQVRQFYEYAYLAECNDALAIQYGLSSADELIGKRLTEFHVPDDPQNYEYLRAFVESGYRLTDTESHEKDADGNDRYFLNNLVGFIEDGKLARVWGTQRDITERKKVETAMRESEESYRILAETASDAIIKIDESSTILFVNQGAEKIFGYRIEEMIGQSLTMLMPENLRGKHLRGFNNYLKTGRRNLQWDGIEIPALHRDGHIFPLEISFGEYCGNNKHFFIGIARDVSERKRVEEVLRENEERFAKAFNSSPLVFTITSLKTGKLIEINETFVQVTGYTREEAIGRTTTELGLWAESAEREKELAAVQREGKLRNLEYRFRMKDGAEIIGLLSAELIEIGGEPCALTVIQDITERKKADEISERYRLLSMYARDVILFLRSDGKIIEANQKAIETYGYDHQSFLQLSIKDLRAPETFPALAEQLEKANEGGVQFETTHRRKDGSEFPVEVSATGVDIGGERMLISIVRDVNERKQAQEALIKAERKAAEEYQALLQRIVPLGQTLGTARDLISIYRAVLEFVRTSMSCSGFFISFYDSENRRRIAAYAWGEGAEVDISELPPMPLTEDGGPNSQAVFQKKTVIINHYWDEQKKRPHVILREDGVNPMSSLVVPMMVKNEVIGTLEVQAHENEAFREEQAIALGMAANLAAVAIENVRLLEVEANARRVAEDANRAKDEFLSVLSHELRTPLNAMLGWVKMLRAGMLDDNRTSQALEVIERNTRLQNNLIEDLLDVSRIISGKMRIEKELVDLKTLVQNSIEILRPAAANKNLEIEFTAQDDSPLIYGDETRLNQIVNNLVQNAVKFTPEGGKISIALKQNGSSTFLSVTDTGVGIERKFLPFIFDRFRQADASTKRSFSGLGLGLTIVRNLVELHGGGIKVESGGKGTGATFTVEIPLAEKFHLEESDADGEHTQPSDNFALKGMRILLVDDDRESLIPLQIFLEREKAEVVSVVSAKDALGKLSEQDFHILISDIGMPETDGYDLISQVREFTTERNAFLPAIALTAYASNEDRRRALSAGFQMHFSKPIDFDELAEAVKSLYKDLK